MNKNNISKSIFNIYNVDRLNKLNIVLDIIICLSTVLLFGFNIWVLAAVYIGSDILLYLFNTYVIRNNIRQTLKTTNVEDFRNLIAENAKDFCCYGQDSKYFKLYNKLIDDFELEVNKIIDNNKQKTEKETKQQDNPINNKEQKEIERVYNTINNFLDFYENLKDIDKTNYCKIKDLFVEIKHLLEEKPKSSSAINNFFTIYTNDLINLTKNLELISSVKQDEYKNNLSDLITEFTTYLIKIKEKVKNYNSATVEIDIDFLLKELKNTNKELE